MKSNDKMATIKDQSVFMSLIKLFLLIVVLTYSYFVINMLYDDYFLATHQSIDVLSRMYSTDAGAIIALIFIIVAFVYYYMHRPAFFWYFHIGVFIAVLSDMVRVDSIVRLSFLEFICQGMILNFLFGVILIYPYLKLQLLKKSKEQII